MDVKCRKCIECHEKVEDEEEKLHDDVEITTYFFIYVIEQAEKVNVNWMWHPQPDLDSVKFRD